LRKYILLLKNAPQHGAKQASHDRRDDSKSLRALTDPKLGVEEKLQILRMNAARVVVQTPTAPKVPETAAAAKGAAPAAALLANALAVPKLSAIAPRQATLVVRVNGETVFTRAYPVNTTLEVVISDILLSTKVGWSGFSLVVSYPRKELDSRMGSRSLEYLGLVPNAVLLLQRSDSEFRFVAPLTDVRADHQPELQAGANSAGSTPAAGCLARLYLRLRNRWFS